MLTETKSVAAYDFYQFFMYLDMNQIIEKNKISIWWQEESEDNHSQYKWVSVDQECQSYTMTMQPTVIRW